MTRVLEKTAYASAIVGGIGLGLTYDNAPLQVFNVVLSASAFVSVDAANRCASRAMNLAAAKGYSNFEPGKTKIHLDRLAVLEDRLT